MFTTDMATSENEDHSRGLIAISICEDPWFCVTREAMQEDVGLWLGIRRRDIDIELFPRKGFLLLLPSSELHDHALSSNGSVPVGRAKLQLLSWTRLVGAEAAKLPFKVRLYVEGVPHHARQESTL
jgi:hypothetical protein